MKYPRSFDIFGNIIVVKFPEDFKVKDKKKFAKDLLKKHKSVRTILEKTGKFKGRLRKQTTKWLAGEKTKEALYKENNCVFRFNVDKTYFSPRLSNERKEIAGKIKKGDEVLVMFAGVGPYPIVIAKNSSASKVYSNEINREANKYAKLNIEMNKVKDKVFLLLGDVKKVAEKLSKGAIPLSNLSDHSPQNANSKKVNTEKFNTEKSRNLLLNAPRKFDVIVMPRPKLKDNFLKQAFLLSKKNTRIFYYDFCKDNEVDFVVEMIKEEARKARKKIRILNVKHAGEIAPYKFRVRIDFRVL